MSAHGVGCSRQGRRDSVRSAEPRSRSADGAIESEDLVCGSVGVEVVESPAVLMVRGGGGGGAAAGVVGVRRTCGTRRAAQSRGDRGPLGRKGGVCRVGRSVGLVAIVVV